MTASAQRSFTEVNSMQPGTIGSSPRSAWTTSANLPGAAARAGVSADKPVAPGLAAALGADANPLAAFEQNGGRLSLWRVTGAGFGASGGPASIGLPMADDGAPDFDAITAAGGKVTGAIPPIGAAKMTYVDGSGKVTTVYAAQIDRGGGTPPMFIKGADLRSSGDSASGRQDQLSATVRFLQQLPDNLQQARAASPDGLKDWVLNPRSLDIHA